ncbi:histidine kinase [Anaerolineae bacterium CFX7]|nr:histidine kinase [Anaerolineae bacterium CFX7]
MSESNPLRILVATMGGQSQVVTLALDWLLAQGEEIAQVIVVHVAPQAPRTHKALEQLASEFPRDHYAFANKAIRLRVLSVRNASAPLQDIRTEADAEATWQFMYRLLAELKQQGHALDLVVAGGRRMMGLMAQSAALLLFGHRDRVWHLYTPEDLRARAHEGAIRHVGPAEGVRLIRAPFVPWGSYFPALREMAGASAARVLDTQIRQLDHAERARCERVLAALTERQRQVLEHLARGSLPQAVAEALNISLKTVDTHKTKILDLCRNEWDVLPETRLDYHFLREKFRGLFE